MGDFFALEKLFTGHYKQPIFVYKKKTFSMVGVRIVAFEFSAPVRPIRLLRLNCQIISAVDCCVLLMEMYKTDIVTENMRKKSYSTH